VRKRIGCILAEVAALAFFSSAQAEVLWEKGSFEEIMAKAGKENKPVMIDFYAVWCGPCKMLDRKTYSDPAVTAFSNKFLNARFDAEKGEGRELARRFKVMNYPTIIFLKPDGTEIDRQIGYLGPREFLKLMRDYYNGVNTLAYFEKKLEQNPNDLEIMLKVASKYVDRADSASAMPLLDKLLELDRDNSHGYAPKALRLKAESERKAGNFELAIKYAKELLERFPEDESAKDVLYDLAYYQKSAGRNEEALGTYKEIITRYPEDVHALNSFAWFCAKSRLVLDLATDVALRAVKLSGGDPGVLDTLAEVYYARGMYDDAIAAIKKAIAKSPGDEYYRRQLSKFEEAKRTKAGE